jgi:hypothetical protein
MKIHLNYTWYLFSRVNLRQIYNFSALLKMRIEKIVLFFLP